jgi:putative ABC transport system ATP-binding protein
MKPTTALQRDMETVGVLQPLIRLRGVGKTYSMGQRVFSALHDVTLEIHRGECVAIMGKSGSGKTTLINLLTGIDSPTEGSLLVASHTIDTMSQEALSVWRGRTVGIVFQFFQLLPTLTVVENVMLPMDFCDTYPSRERRARALTLLNKLSIAEQADKLPADLSGGQQQRVAIARALANDPSVIVADEPTGNLDSATSHEVMTLLAGLAQEGKTVLTVTHERELSQYFSRTITLRDGVVADDTGTTGPRGAVGAAGAR